MSKKCMPLWREAHFEIKIYKAHHARTTFGSCDVEKMRAVVARNTFVSEKVKRTSCSEYFWKLRCRKSVCRCGAKHISKSKYTKHPIFGPLLEVKMSKKCTPLWREAHFEVKIYKAHHGRTTFGSYDVEKVHAVVARSSFRNQNNKIISGVRTTFGRSNVVSRGRRKGLWILSKVRKMWGFVVSKNDGSCGIFEENLQGVVGYLKKIYKDVFSVADAVQETCSSKLLGGPDTNFLKGLLR